MRRDPRGVSLGRLDDRCAMNAALAAARRVSVRRLASALRWSGRTGLGREYGTLGTDYCVTVV